MDITLIILFEKAKLSKLEATALGIWHGISGHRAWYKVNVYKAGMRLSIVMCTYNGACLSEQLIASPPDQSTGRNVGL
jgi:hypothetical protein